LAANYVPAVPDPLAELKCSSGPLPVARRSAGNKRREEKEGKRGRRGKSKKKGREGDGKEVEGTPCVSLNFP